MTHYINEELKSEGVPVTVMTGREIRVHDDLLDAWERMEQQ
ncbi:hypothetical protein [Paenibacillus harenae]|nr:hypothetical protein [Paenibacillus harenae]